jgi:hypothetical protein
MKQRFILALAALLCAANGLFAQSVVVLSIPDVVAPEGTTEVCVPVIADTFPNIVTIQFSLEWDTTQLNFTELRLGDNPFGFDGMYSSMPVSNNIAISHIPSNSRGVTLDAGTVLFEACFNTSMMEGSSTVTFDGFLPSEFAQDDGSFTAVPNTLHAGSISYGSSAAVSVLPGDTNDDQQVDHRDILNIGYIYGVSGSARSILSSDFSPQSAAVWNGSFTSGLNHAEADANGNGTIDAEDLAVVRTNYDMALNSTFNVAPDVSNETGPALSIETEEVINAGEETSITVNLGDGNNPDAVGYAIAFALEFDPSLVDVNSIRVDYDGSFLGNDILKLDNLSSHANGRFEIATSRKDQLNTTTPGGKVCTISFIPLNPNGAESFPVEFKVVPNAFVRADQSNGAINGSATTVDVQGSNAVQEPSWAAELSIFPNPYTNGPLSIRGELPLFDAVKVLDLNGRIIKTWNGNFRQLDLEELPTATYLLQIEVNGQVVNRKVVKQ